MAWTLQPWHGKSLVEGAATLAFQKCLKSKQQSAHWNKLRTSMTYVANISLDENFKKYFTKSSNIPKSNWLWNKSWGRLKFVAQDDRMWHSSRAKRRIRILRPASQSSLAKWTPRNSDGLHTPHTANTTSMIQGDALEARIKFNQDILDLRNRWKHCKVCLFSRKIPCLNLCCTALPRRDSAQPLHFSGSIWSHRVSRTESVRVNEIGPPGSRKHRPPSLSKELSCKFGPLDWLDQIRNSENWPWQRARRSSATRTVAGCQHPRGI